MHTVFAISVVYPREIKFLTYVFGHDFDVKKLNFANF